MKNDVSRETKPRSGVFGDLNDDANAVCALLTHTGYGSARLAEDRQRSLDGVVKGRQVGNGEFARNTALWWRLRA